MPNQAGIQPLPKNAPLSATAQPLLADIAAKFPDSQQFSFGTLLRFVRGYASDERPLEKPIEMVGEFLEWRKSANVEELIKIKLPKAEKFYSVWPCGIHGQDKEGHIVYIERPGQVTPKELAKNFTSPEIIDLHIQMMEALCRTKDEACEKEGHRLYKHTVILDLDGVGMGHLGSDFTTPLKLVMEIDQSRYPETLHRLVVCNAPWMMKALWKIIGPWLDPITREKILFGTDKLAELLTPENIPKFLGGACSCDVCLTGPPNHAVVSEDAQAEPAYAQLVEDVPAEANGAYEVAEGKE